MDNLTLTGEEEKNKFILENMKEQKNMYISSYIETEQQMCIHEIIKYAITEQLTMDHNEIVPYTVTNKKRIIYLLPMKSLCNQLYKTYTEYYKEMIALKKISIGIVTGDRVINLYANLLIMTPECLLQMLYKFKIPTIDIVLFDKFQYINDKERGKYIEELVWILPTTIQIIFFSLPFENLTKLTNWIQDMSEKTLVIIENNDKSYSLNHYIYYDLHPQFYSQLPLENQGYILERIQKCILLTEEVISKVYTDIQDFKETNGYVKKDYLMNKLLQTENIFPAVCLVLSRRNLERLVENIHVTLNENKNMEEICLDILKKFPNYQDYTELLEYKLLLKLFKRGIGIHHAGMLSVFKELVEILFEKEYLKIIFSTETFFTATFHSVKTIILTENVKFDGTEERPLLSSEYSSYFQKIRVNQGNVIHLPNFYSSFYLDSFEHFFTDKKEQYSSKFYYTYSFVFQHIKQKKELIEEGDFKAVYDVLVKHEFLREGNELTAKGFVASEITEIFSLFIAEHFYEMCELSNKNIVCLLSCFINVNPNIHLNYHFTFPIEEELQNIIAKVLKSMSEYESYTIDNNYYFQYYLLEYVSLWYDATEAECKKILDKIKKDKVLFVGDFVKAVLKIICTMNEIKKISISMESHCDEIISKLLKHIVSNQSLYI
jgi:superfamily II RNA helicase